jgi:hypothetical protein
MRPRNQRDALGDHRQLSPAPDMLPRRPWAAECKEETLGSGVLFDYVVCELLELCRHVEAESFRCLEIDDQLKLSWELHRQIRRLRALEDAIDIRCRAPEQIGRVIAENSPPLSGGPGSRRGCPMR